MILIQDLFVGGLDRQPTAYPCCVAVRNNSVIRFVLYTLLMLVLVSPAHAHCGCDHGLASATTDQPMTASILSSRVSVPPGPLPDRAQLLFVGAHPDDEGIFSGGLLPYYAQTLDMNVAAVSIVTRNANGFDPLTAGNGANRLQELRNAYDTYAGQALGSGTTNNFGAYVTGNITSTNLSFVDSGGYNAAGNAQVSWNAWGSNGTVSQVTPGYGNTDFISDGRYAAAFAIARQIRLYRPDVVVAGHDLEGDYGHSDHSAAAIALIDAFALAGDETVDIDGLAAWQAQTLYLRGDADDNRASISWGAGAQSFHSDGGINSLFHDFFEDPTINGQTPRQVADAGVDQHVSQGSNVTNVASVFEPQIHQVASFRDSPSEWWTLYESTVGPDTLSSTFTVPGDWTGSPYSGFALGNFFENVQESLLADFNSDGTIGVEDLDILLAHWGQEATLRGQLSEGDADGDGFIGDGDLSILLASWGQSNQSANVIPEPGTAVLAALLSVLSLKRRRIIFDPPPLSAPCGAGGFYSEIESPMKHSVTSVRLDIESV